MRIPALLLTVLMATGSVFGLGTPKDDGPLKDKKPKKTTTTYKKPLLRGMHARMAKECKLDRDQQREIARLSRLRNEALKEYKKSISQEHRDLRAQLVQARKKGDKKAVKETYGKLLALRKRPKEIRKQWRVKIMAVLTPEQLAEWRKYQAMLGVKRRFKTAALKKDQFALIEAAYTEQVASVDPADKKARTQAMKKLFEYISKEILTEAQRTATTKPKRKTTTQPSDSEKTKKSERSKDKKAVKGAREK